jgi:[ribosomal protein S5]-alanine N-acetyltransferase
MNEPGRVDLLVRGPTLSLRYPRVSDAAALFGLARDADVTRFFSWGPYRDQHEACAWLTTLPQRRAAGVALELAIVNDSDAAIGVILLSELHRRDRRAVIGTWLGRDHWGTGANREAKALMAHLAFEGLGVERLGAYADVCNTRSQAALERVGFTQEGILRAFHRHRGIPRDVKLYSLMREQWCCTELAKTPVAISGELPRPFIVR